MSFLACSAPSSNVLGIWETTSSYYSATYDIHQEVNGICIEVVRYDDGTSRYDRVNGDTFFLSRNITYSRKEKNFVDGSSGATRSEIRLTLIGKDSLRFEEVGNTPEIWIRNAKTYE
ncbi:MAG: hypothetical protein JJ975_09310 [Bacteroidia bacterium]|nr:hypothetical protein [Bacteroidia bacterium]